MPASSSPPARPSRRWSRPAAPGSRPTSRKPSSPTCRPVSRRALRVDAFPGKLECKVASIGAATGSEFSLIPAQNATGNWVKVVQRLPVRIECPTDEGRAAQDRHERQRRGRYRPHHARQDARQVNRPGAASGRAQPLPPWRPVVAKAPQTLSAPTDRRQAQGPADVGPDAGHDHAGARHDDRQRRAAAHGGVARRRRRTKSSGC